MKGGRKETKIGCTFLVQIQRLKLTRNESVALFMDMFETTRPTVKIKPNKNSANPGMKYL